MDKLYVIKNRAEGPGGRTDGPGGRKEGRTDRVEGRKEGPGGRTDRCERAEMTSTGVFSPNQKMRGEG